MSKDVSRLIKLKLLFSVLIIFILVGSSKYLAAQEIKVSSFVDKDKISLDDFLNFTIKIEGIDNAYKNPQIKLPPLEDNFNIAATSQSNNINIKGNKMQIVWQMQYTLTSKKEGLVEIDSAEIIYKGNTYKTEPLTITVGPSSRPRPKELLPEQPPPKKVPWQDKEGVFI